MKWIASIVVACCLVACVKASVFKPPLNGWESVIKEQSETVGDQVFWSSSFDLNTTARLQIDWLIEPDRMVTYVLATDEQVMRITNAGADFTYQGTDYIRRMDALRGQGNDVTDALAPGRYHVVIRNTENAAPVKVTIRALGLRQ